MTEMSISDSTVAIIGTGTIGGTLAANFATGGQDFLLADRDQQATRKLASSLDGHAEAVSIDEAIDRAGVLVVAVWLDPFKIRIRSESSGCPDRPPWSGGVRSVCEKSVRGRCLSSCWEAFARTHGFPVTGTPWAEQGRSQYL
jgi:F420-dependent NADP oxidoreductase-like protein